jgi:hypothetical protein
LRRNDYEFSRTGKSRQQQFGSSHTLMRTPRSTKQPQSAQRISITSDLRNWNPSTASWHFSTKRKLLHRCPLFLGNLTQR